MSVLSRQLNRTDRRRVNMNIPISLHDCGKRQAGKEGTDFTNLMIRLLRQHLSAENALSPDLEQAWSLDELRSLERGMDDAARMIQRFYYRIDPKADLGKGPMFRRMAGFFEEAGGKFGPPFELDMRTKARFCELVNGFRKDDPADRERKLLRQNLESFLLLLGAYRQLYHVRRRIVEVPVQEEPKLEAVGGVSFPSTLAEEHLPVVYAPPKPPLKPTRTSKELEEKKRQASSAFSDIPFIPWDTEKSEDGSA